MAMARLLGGESAEAKTDGFIDAHVHVWTPDVKRYPPVPARAGKPLVVASFTPEEFFAQAQPCGVRRAVLIQYSYYGFDNSYLLDSMKRFPGVFSGVADIDVGGRAGEAMLALAAQGIRGFRLRPGEASPQEWLTDAASQSMWKCAADHGLAVCPLIDPEYLPALQRMCRRLPDTPVVVDHFARIGVDGKIREADVARLCELAACKRVCVKVSAFSALGAKRAPYLDLADMIRRLLDRFGPERLMWGTDSPFQTTGDHTYRDSSELIRSRLDFLSAGDREWMLRRSAERMFFG